MTLDVEFVRHRPIAHRGLHDLASGVAENSLAAVRRAARAGLGVEVDVRLTRDGRAVVFHDARLERVCGVPGRVVERSAADLRRLSLDGTDDHLPSLREVLACLRGEAPLLLDLKCGLRRGERAALAAAVAADLRAYAGPVAAVSFDPLALRALAAAAPHVPRGQSAGIPRAGLPLSGLLMPATRPVDNYWGRALSLPHFVTFNVDRLPFESLQATRRRGVLAVGWTVRGHEQLGAMAQHVDNVIVEGPAAAALAR